MKNICLTLSICASLLVAVATASAEERKFETTVSAGAALTDGNSETLQANASIVAEGEIENLGSVRGGVVGNYGETTANDEKETTVENAQAFANAKRTLSPAAFAYLDTSLLYDNIARIDSRATLGPGAGMFLMKNDTTKISAEAGLSYIWEDVADIDDEYAAARVAERFDHQLNHSARIWQSVEFLPQIDDFGNYLINAEVGVEAALNSRLNLRLVLHNRYDSEPGAGLEQNDLSLIAGVSIKL